MKSAIFESINDRSNIANAYMRMVNEASEELQNRYNDIPVISCYRMLVWKDKRR